MIYVFLMNTLIVTVCVIVHYEFLYRITLYIPEMKMIHRYRIVFAIFGALLAHTLEIWIFALAYYFMHHAEGWGALTENFNGSLLDCVYFSFTVYTTLGFGDIVPTGPIRYLTGIESLTGFVLITWTASFLYYEMQRHWGRSNERL